MSETKSFESLRQNASSISENNYQSLHLLEGTAEDWNDRVKKVVVILSASRSGSSLIFKSLSESDNTVAPAGEHEPWLFLTGNKSPFLQSDSILEVRNKPRLLKLLRNDLLVRSDSVGSDEFFDLARNRLVVRSETEQKKRLENIFEMYKGQNIDEKNAEQILKQVGWGVIPNISGREDLYWPIENPPYIEQPLARRATDEELYSRVLLFKSPSDAYRPGFYEALFPNAKVTYVHLTRGFAQTVNGLMDGWTKDEVGFISNPVGISNKLNIVGYSHSGVTRNYWCFDLFPDWQEFTNTPLLEVCAQQWLTAHTSILANFPIAARIQFESFYEDRDQLLQDLARYTTIEPNTFDWDKTVMSTDKPSQFRWKKRESIFTDLKKWLARETFERVVELQQRLGYSMDETTWR